MFRALKGIRSCMLFGGCWRGTNRLRSRSVQRFRLTTPAWTQRVSSELYRWLWPGESPAYFLACVVTADWRGGRGERGSRLQRGG